MSFIRTVTGDIPPAELGLTDCHDHLLWRVPPELDIDDPDLGLPDEATAKRELEHYKRAGGGTLVEMTTTELARDPQALQRLSNQSGVQIIAATGYNKAKYSQPVVGDRSTDSLAEEMIDDLINGMEGTFIQAGLIKVSTSLRKATASERRVIEAAGRAHRQVGAPISTHTEAGTFALEQIDLLQQAGIELDRALIGHLDRNLDIDYHLRIAERGVYLGFDQIGKAKYAPDERRAKFIEELVKHGYGKQILLGMDIARKSGWPSFGFAHGPGLTHLPWNFLTRLRRAGLSEETIKGFVIDNPARWLTFHQPSHE